MSNAFHCDCCNRTYRREETIPSIEGTLLGALTGLVIGASTRSAPAAFLFCIAGAMVGRVVDEEIAPRCPQCAKALKAVARSFLSAQGAAAPLKLLHVAGLLTGASSPTRVGRRPKALALPRF